MPTLFISPEFLSEPGPPLQEKAISRFFRRLFMPSLQGVWLDADDHPVGEAFKLPEPTTRPVEFGDGKGGYAIEEVAAPIHLEAEIPPGAERLRIMRGANRMLGRVSLASLGRDRSPGRGKEKLFPPSGGTFRIDVIGDRFASEADFFLLVEELYDHWTTEQFPFTQSAIKGVFAIRALFWPSDEQQGNFHTPDSAIKGRVLQGNADLVRSYQEAHGDPADFVLVLINSKRRAGAGGAVFRKEWAPAWMTITSNAWEDWRAIALHEFGHAFGLADEYDAPPYELNVTHFEPNVSQSGGCSQAPKPWSRMCVDAAEPYQRLFDDDRPVASILGARYEPEGWYRPHPDCLMRTPTAKFCPVCAEYLGLRMLGRVSPAARLS